MKWLLVLVALVSLAHAKRISDWQLRIIQVDVQGNATIITVQKPKDLAVTKDWHITVIDRQGKPVMNGECTFIKSLRERLIARCKMTHDQIMANARVRLAPP